MLTCDDSHCNDNPKRECGWWAEWGFTLERRENQ